MEKYKVRIKSLETPNTPYIPDVMLKHMDIWKTIAQTLLDCGFIHVGDFMVLGRDANVFEFKMTFQYDPNVFKIDFDLIE